jgi:muconate cycloisomerase
MRLVSAALFALEIPFVESFRHHLKDRTACDSVVVRVRDDAGIEGFGEGVPRPYVTGETADLMLEHIAERLWPGVAERPVPSLAGGASLDDVVALLPEAGIPGVRSDNASRAALELALLDCLLRREGLAADRLLPPRRTKVVYSGVITAGTPEKALQHARHMKLVGLKHVKLKVGYPDDVARIRATRKALGPDVSLRLDANGGWTRARAMDVLGAVAPLGIAAVEEPLPRGPVDELSRLRAAVPVPVMADESLVTPADADALIAASAVDYFNVRVSKCGGLARSLAIARRAAAAGIGVQVGCQVGETAILSAAGRHLAAALPDVAFVEGSYGTLLLSEDVSADGVRFGHRGEAALLKGRGLGVRVLEARLRKHARRVVELSADGGRP